MYRREILLDKLIMAFPDDNNIAKLIEQSVFDFSAKETKTTEKHWDNKKFIKEYATNARKIIFNLTQGPNKKNILFKIDNKQLNPTELVEMSHKELYPEFWKQYCKVIENAPDEVAPDHKGIMKCMKCKSWRTSFYQLQVRSPDEPMTCYFTCYNCGNRWRI